MPTNKYRIAEQALLRLRGGKPDASSPYQMDDLMLAVGQIANTLIKATHFNETLPGGDTVPDTCIVAAYTDLPVVAYKNVSKVTMPCMPVNLRRMQGIRQVGDVEDEYSHFIPMPGDSFLLIDKEPLINELLNQVGYKQQNFDLVFNRDITDEYKTIEVKILTYDIDKYDNYSPLPLPSDYESIIIERLVEQFGGKSMAANPNTDLINDVK